jgi:hypothetical protein
MVEQDRSTPLLDTFNHAKADADPITHPLREREGGEHVTGEAHRSENDRRLRIGTAGLILGTRGARSLSCEIEVMRSPATRFVGKSFPRVAKYFASQNVM